MIREREYIYDINGYSLHIVPTKKFKTIHLVAKFKAPLNREDITKRALIPYLLVQGTIHYPTRKDLEEKLDDLYGSVLTADSSKKGNEHIISVRFDMANEKFVKSNTLFQDALRLFSEIIFKPHINNGAFPTKIFQREKMTLKRKIEAVVDDKMTYANMRLIEEMCANERYRMPAHGFGEDLDGLTSQSVYQYYQEMLSKDGLDLYVVGDVEQDDIVELFSNHLKREIFKSNHIDKDIEEQIITRDKEKMIVEYQDIQQAKLHMGYRTSLTFRDKLYPALHVFNGLFGAFPSSKLFINVREKNSLAYYAASRIESHKGLLFVFSGIAPEDYTAAKVIIDEQLKAMQAGDFTENDIQKTKELIINQIKETFDHPQGIIELLYQQVVGKADLSPQNLLEAIRQVTKQDIIRVAQAIQLDTVYLLTKEGVEIDA
ncbi:MAG TPA: pitrilysin family protein [Cerasibacillus sp.]|uniref:EF-P 5-aminopentanol modification-associated protein YfmF n=1 Tax=Cerasibacillus sp. TaxID=2498711 RepID=UPI002F3EFE37